MGYLKSAINNFFAFVREFGLTAAVQIFKNNRSRSPQKSLRISGYQYPFYYRQGTTDFPILRIIIGRQLVYTDMKTPSLIIDAGANAGYLSVLYANLFKNAEIVAIEMENTNFDLLVKNTRPYSNITPIEAALWNHSDGILFSKNSGHDSYSLVDGKPPDCKVDSITLTSILKRFPNKSIDLLKLDIEGAEIEVLNYMGENDIQPRVLVIELHERFRPGCFAALDKYLKNRSYRRLEKVYVDEVIEFV